MLGGGTTCWSPPGDPLAPTGPTSCRQSARAPWSAVRRPRQEVLQLSGVCTEGCSRQSSGRHSKWELLLFKHSLCSGWLKEFFSCKGGTRTSPSPSPSTRGGVPGLAVGECRGWGRFPWRGWWDRRGRGKLSSENPNCFMVLNFFSKQGLLSQLGLFRRSDV